jgi:bifunctional ADP-heptose synthase (sugar kinase/adenylyltransferase)
VVTDRVGAGDAVLAITAPLVAIGAPWDIVGFIGNIAGGQMVADLGNRVTINRVSLVKAITALMK